MTSCGGDAPSLNGGEFLRQLLMKPDHHPQSMPSEPHTHDPAVVAVGPTIAFQSQLFPPPPNGFYRYSSQPVLEPQMWQHYQSPHPPPPIAPHMFFCQNPNRVVNFTPSSQPPSIQALLRLNHTPIGDDVNGLEFSGTNVIPGSIHQNDHNIVFGTLHGEGRSSGTPLNGDENTVNDLDHLVGSLRLDDGSEEQSNNGKHQRSGDRDNRSDKRGKWLLGQRMRILRRHVQCRGDILKLNFPFIAIYKSLLPAEEEKARQKHLLALLERIIGKEWPEARLHVYGSCANSFGFSKSDIDVCLEFEDVEINKPEVLLKLAELLEAYKLENVQALTHARVPIVKLMDPATGISCDICINNVLAVVNTKLLRDYARIDARLRQLVFIVKYWAKRRGVNETYQGTLSSYAYVLMCIHFLQARRPAILPCLQEMEATYSVTAENTQCAFFDRVDRLCDFGARNRQSIAPLVWQFFNYWAYCHDYATDVISVRTGCTLSKQAKDWTRRIGNDRHLICIEDPFDTSHDLGRVVDKYSIRVLREEFERAAEIMQYDPNPCEKLFEPYVPE